MPPHITTLGLLLTGCGGSGSEGPGGDGGTDTATGLELLDLELVESAEVPSVYTARWRTSTAASSKIVLSREDHADLVVSDEAETEDHELLIMGLAAGARYQWEVLSVAPDGARASSEPAALDVATAPSWIPELTVVESRNHLGGHVLLNVGSDTASGLIMVNRDGEVVWWSEAGEGRSSTSHTLRIDGGAVLFASQDPSFGTELGEILEVALDGSWSTRHSAPALHHAFAELPSGALAFLGARVVDHDGQELIEDTVELLGTDGDQQTLFAALDHYEPEALCTHYEQVAYAGGAIDWLHANSLVYDSEAGVLLMMMRNLDTLVAIDAEEGLPLWTLGGASTNYDWVDPDQSQWDHPHFSQVRADGLLAMDTGSHREPDTSRAVEYTLDREARTATLEWEYWDPEGRSIAEVGDVRRMANDHRLVSWSTEGFVTELDDQDVVWQLNAEPGFSFGFVTHLPVLPGGALGGGAEGPGGGTSGKKGG